MRPKVCTIPGALLADELEALLKRRPDLAKSKVGMIVRGKSNGIADLRKTPMVSPRTAAKVREFIANPPDEAKRKLRSEYKRPDFGVGYRIAAGIRRSAARKAQERIDAGLSAESASSAALRLTQRDMEANLREQGRLSDPIEQAKSKLQRARYVPVCSMSIYGGDPSLFRVGQKTNLTTDQLLQMAEAA